MRIIQDGSPNQFMVLLRFRCQEAADEFYQAFNGQRFNSLEADVCSLVYVSKVETCKESEFYPMAGHTELPVCSICLESEDLHVIQKSKCQTNPVHRDGRVHIHRADHSVQPLVSRLLSRPVGGLDLPGLSICTDPGGGGGAAVLRLQIGRRSVDLPHLRLRRVRAVRWRSLSRALSHHSALLHHGVGPEPRLGLRWGQFCASSGAD